MRCKPLPIDKHTSLLRCRPRVLWPVIASSIRCTAANKQHPSNSFPARDVLLLDATNILSRAAIDAKRCSDAPGVSIRRCFEAWVDFLIAATAPRLLVIAVFDNPAAGGNLKQQNNQDYLRRRRHQRQHNKENLSPTPPTNAGKLKPFIECIESLDRGIALISKGGYEADECIGAVCTLLTKENKSTVSILIASGDSDMQQYLVNSTISWLHIASLPTLTAPSALSLVTEASFLSTNNFPPSAYSDFLALVGKKEANIGGVGIGSSVAAKLLKQFGSIHGIEQAAKQGILKGWPPAVEDAILSPSKAAQLERNREIFSTTTDPEVVLTATQREKLLSPQIGREESKESMNAVPSRRKNPMKRKADSTTVSSESTLAWQHPIYAIRWLQAGPLANTLERHLECRNIGPIQLQAATSQGLPMDILINGSGGGGGDNSGSGDSEVIGIMVCAPCDFDESKGAITSQKDKGSDIDDTLMNSVIDSIEEMKSKRGGGGASREESLPRVSCIYDPGRVVKKLNRAVQHHISLLKKSNVDTVLVPYWIVDEKESILGQKN